MRDPETSYPGPLASEDSVRVGEALRELRAAEEEVVIHGPKGEGWHKPLAYLDGHVARLRRAQRAYAEALDRSSIEEKPVEIEAVQAGGERERDYPAMLKRCHESATKMALDLERLREALERIADQSDLASYTWESAYKKAVAEARAALEAAGGTPEGLEAEYDNLKGHRDRLWKQRDEARAELERLREVLEAMRTILDHFHRYASVDDGTPYAGSPFEAVVLAAREAAEMLRAALYVLQGEGEGHPHALQDNPVLEDQPPPSAPSAGNPGPLTPEVTLTLRDEAAITDLIDLLSEDGEERWAPALAELRALASTEGHDALKDDAPAG